MSHPDQTTTSADSAVDATVDAIVEQMRALYAQSAVAYHEGYVLMEQVYALEDQLIGAYAAALWRDHWRWHQDKPTAQRRVKRLSERLAQQATQDIAQDYRDGLAQQQTGPEGQEGARHHDA